MTTRGEPQRVEPADLAGWRAWLAEHHATSPSVWLVVPRRPAPEAGLDYESLVCEALCWGWVDGQFQGVDESRLAQHWARRNPRSGWSRTNQARIARLEQAGLLQPAGAACVAAAKASGAWTLLDDAEDGVEPAALTAALDALPAARAHWDAFPRSARKLGLTQIATARQEATRARRIATLVERAARGERP